MRTILRSMQDWLRCIAVESQCQLHRQELEVQHHLPKSYLEAITVWTLVPFNGEEPTIVIDKQFSKPMQNGMCDEHSQIFIVRGEYYLQILNDTYLVGPIIRGSMGFDLSDYDNHVSELEHLMKYVERHTFKKNLTIAEHISKDDIDRLLQKSLDWMHVSQNWSLEIARHDKQDYPSIHWWNARLGEDANDEFTYTDDYWYLLSDGEWVRASEIEEVMA